ncbi:hypothetical protein [Aminipila sp.]|uniref:hypothetical protein n=1 Tax=Aminipila sp. TaxID=2060095 RepID=UPI00289CABC7|nr:hypothetical protein [Aminipila sp.]
MKEHSAVIVRTKQGNRFDVFSFITQGYNNGNVLPQFAKPCRWADEIEISNYVGGMLGIKLTDYRTNGEIDYPIVEKVMFDKNLVIGIEIFTEFDCCRSKEGQANE